MSMRQALAFVVCAAWGLGCGSNGRTMTAKVLMGASPVSGQAGQPLTAVGQVKQAATAGQWLISPNQAKVTFTRIDFVEPDGSNRSGDLKDCEATYDRSKASGTALLDCPFQIAPGPFVAIYIYFAPTVEVLIDDPQSGIFSDPSSPTMLSHTSPAGGAGFVPYTIATEYDAITAQTYLPQQMEIPSDGTEAGEGVLNGDAPSIGIVTDMIHTLRAETDSSMALAFSANSGARPVEVLATVSGQGSSAYYASTSALNTQGTPTSVRIFYSDVQVPAVAQVSYLQGCMEGNTPSGAFSASPQTSPPTGTDFKAGGYLGRDETGKLAWALPKSYTWEEYSAVYVMPEATALGGSTTLLCQSMTSAPPPVSGDTYASGSPTLASPTGQASLTLIAH